MKKIFLASYFAKVVEQFKAFVQNNEIKTKRILFIPTASNVEEYTEYVAEGKQAPVSYTHLTLPTNREV